MAIKIVVKKDKSLYAEIINNVTELRNILGENYTFVKLFDNGDKKFFQKSIYVVCKETNLVKSITTEEGMRMFPYEEMANKTNNINFMCKDAIFYGEVVLVAKTGFRTVTLEREDIDKIKNIFNIDLLKEII